MRRGPATDLFLALTPEKVLAAVERAGLPCRPLCYPLNSFENRVYEVELADRTRVVAKFYRPGRWSLAQLREEHAFLAELAAAEIPVVPALDLGGGETLAEIEGIFYALHPRRGGRAPEDLDAALARRLGRLVARLHGVGAARPASARIALTSAAYLRADLAWLARARQPSPPLQRRFVAAAEALADRYDRAVAGVPFQRLHGDLHLGNLLLRDELLHVVDFDDHLSGPPVQDLWLMVPGRDTESLALREELLAGYEELRPFDRSTLALIEPLRGLRMARHALWIARRFHDPIFPRTWPEYGTDEGWRVAIEALEEQLAFLDGARADESEAISTDRAATREPERELTNADYFWDWEEGRKPS